MNNILSTAIKHNKADVMGIISSSLCVIHCIATPLLLTFGASFFTHPVFQYLFLGISLLSIIKVTKQSGHLKINVLLWVSFIGFCLATLLEDELAGAEIIGYAFATLIITGHVLHIRHCKQCKKL